jgi:hypothetical protein
VPASPSVHQSKRLSLAQRKSIEKAEVNPPSLSLQEIL